MRNKEREMNINAISTNFKGELRVQAQGSKINNLKKLLK